MAIRTTALLLALPLAVLAYLYGLDGLHIPHTGDEAPYLQITRLTAESGSLLPLQAAEGLDNTKPPFLFWLGIAASGWARQWDLLTLRLPIVAFTFLTAWLVGWTAWRLSTRLRSGVVAALAFLAFWTTFQYGRPFLMNLPETFFLFWPFALAAVDPERMERWQYWIFAGVSVGAACLFKSFALIVPVAVAYAAWLVLRRTPWTRILARGAVACSVALGCFLLWPLFDPNPMGILRDFVWQENVGKVGGGWLEGLVSPTHGIWTTVLGPFFNAGFLVLPVVWLVLDAFRRQRSDAENALWIFLLAFVVVFSLVSHRQSNYLIPAMPAVAVLLGSAWDRVPRLVFGATACALAVAALAAFLFQRMASGVLPSGSWALWQHLVPAVAFVPAVIAAARPRFASALVLPLVFLGYLSLGAALAPFEGPAGRFDAVAVESVAGDRVYVPSGFRSRYERHRFLLPGADVRGYRRKDEAAPTRLLDEGEIVAVRGEAPDDTIQLGSRLDLRTRHTAEEIRQILLEWNVEILVEPEIIVVRKGDA